MVGIIAPGRFGPMVWGGTSGGGGNAFTLIANTHTDWVSGGSSAPITTAAIDTTGANLIVIAVSAYQGGGTPTVSDSKGNTYAALTQQKTANEAYTRLFYKAGPTVGSGHTFSVNSFSNGVIAVQAWSGANAAPFDVENGANTLSSVGSFAPGAAVPNNNNSLIIAAATSTTGSSGAYSVNSSFTISDQQATVSGVEGLAMAYLKQNTAASVNPTFSWTGNSDSAAVIAVFKP